LSKLAIGEKYSFFGLIRFTMPSICMMVCFSLYTIIDGMFISRFVGANALAATNIVFPLINIVLGVSIMFAAGGSAVVAKNLGQGRQKLASRRFTLIVIAAAGLTATIAAVSLAFLSFWLELLGATDILYQDARDYAFWMLLGAPILTAKILFDHFFVVAGRPKLAFYNALLGGSANIFFDYLFILCMDKGVVGAAQATVISYLLPALAGMIYFNGNSPVLRFQKTRLEGKLLLKVSSNGSSEMVSELSAAISTYCFNAMMLKYVGESGVTAITIVLYSEFLLTAMFLGFSSGCAPVISYWYGYGDRKELLRVVHMCYRFTGILAALSFFAAQALAGPLVHFFTETPPLWEMTVHGFRLFSISFLFSGFTLLTSGIFTALSNGRISAFISFMRSLALFLVCIAILPLLFGLQGIWLTVPVADFLAAILAFFYYRSSIV